MVQQKYLELRIWPGGDDVIIFHELPQYGQIRVSIYLKKNPISYSDIV